MSANEYQRKAMKTANTDYKEVKNKLDPQLMEGLVGLCGESGECIDILKKYLFQEHELDVTHLVEELGDVIWYVALTADAIGYDLESVMTMNIAKIMARYPNGFDAKRSVNRD